MTAAIIENVILVTAIGFFPMAYISCYLLAIYLRRYVSLQKPRGQKWVLFAVAAVCICAFGVTLHNHTWTGRASVGIGEIEIFDGERYNSNTVGKLSYTSSYRPRQVTAVGYLEVKGQYYKIKVADGEVMAPDVPEKYCSDAAAGLKEEGNLSKAFSGVSEPYNELAARDDTYYYPMSRAGWLIGILVTFGPLIAVLTDMLQEYGKRKHRNRLLKTRLKDL